MLQRTKQVLRSLSRRRSASRLASSLLAQTEGLPLSTLDTKAAIAELSQVAKSHPESTEIYQALGNLYRAQGEVERAIQIRQGLLVRTGLADHLKARTLYELGLDYKRGGFIDRAQHSFDQARELSGDEPAIIEEMAGLAAASRNFRLAAEYFQLLNKPVPQAHYLVQQAKDAFQEKDYSGGRRLLKEALQIYPGSVEAWIEHMIQEYSLGSWDGLASSFKKGLKKVDPGLRFVLLEGLIQRLINKRQDNEIFSPLIAQEACQSLLKILRKQPSSVALSYYGAWLDLQIGQTDRAKEWLQQSLEQDPDFWPARLELLSLSLDSESLSQEFKAQLDFFLRKGRSMKRFLCKRCGMKREQIFFVCPRCRSWHSLSFIRE
jgi:lipopolysaccharide biosynthesis regulator YciM